MRRVISGLYGMLVALRNQRYDRGIGIRQIGIPVVSVGNLTAGGTGKTPMIIALAVRLETMGRRVAVVARGYKRRRRGVVVVSDGHSRCVSVRDSGDELALVAERVPGAIVIAARNRYEGACIARERFGADIVLLDDGFQHRALARSLDIVMVDAATLDPGNDLLPRGTLREPLSSLRRAHILCAMGIGRADVEPYAAAGAYVVEASAHLRQWRTLHGERTIPPVGSVLAVSAIANPRRFVTMLTGSSSIGVVEHLLWRDHHWYSESDVQHIIERALTHSVRYIVTTEKDAVKLRAFAPMFARAGCIVKVARLSLEFSQGDEMVLESMLSKLCAVS